jgi:hypothetical protein
VYKVRLVACDENNSTAVAHYVAHGLKQVDLSVAVQTQCIVFTLAGLHAAHKGAAEQFCSRGMGQKSLQRGRILRQFRCRAAKREARAHRHGIRDQAAQKRHTRMLGLV